MYTPNTLQDHTTGKAGGERGEEKRGAGGHSVSVYTYRVSTDERGASIDSSKTTVADGLA